MWGMKFVALHVWCVVCGWVACQFSPQMHGQGHCMQMLQCTCCIPQHRSQTPCPSPLYFPAQMFSLFVIQGDSLQGPPDAAMMTTFDIVRVDC